jgi:pimeloyl-ACP methyl ester carboxylesterase
MLAEVPAVPAGADAAAEPRPGRTLGYAQGRFHDLAYVEWGDPASPHTVLCLHGLSRQGRDFDPLARALVGLGYRVVCPDIVGRGRSGWLADPELYGLPQYARDMAALIAHLGVAQLDWIGTSLGGLVGMVLAGAQNTPIRRLVMNDIGPFLPWAALRGIGNRLREAPRLHHSLATAEARLRSALADFGTLTDAQWRAMTRHSFVAEPGGTWRPHYDPAIAVAFRPGRVYNVTMWRDWDAVRCPVLLLRGETSDLLLPQTAAEMTRRGPRATLVEIPGCGHAPALLDDDQIRIVTDWMGRAG